MSRNAALDAHLADAFRDLEGPVEDMRRATIILETVHSQAMTPAKVLKVPDPNYRAYLLTDDQEAGLAYAVTHVGDLARKLVQDWDAAADDARTARQARSATPPPQPMDDIDIMDLEAPLRKAQGLAKAFRLMSVNPITDGIDPEPVYVLGSEIEATLREMEKTWEALILPRRRWRTRARRVRRRAIRCSRSDRAETESENAKTPNFAVISGD